MSFNVFIIHYHLLFRPPYKINTNFQSADLPGKHSVQKLQQQ